MSFIRNYLKFCEQNEAAELFHVWCGLTILSVVVGRKVWINLGHITIYPNLYVVLVSPPGNRKTTAMDPAREFVRELGGYHIAGEATSKEGLVLQMAETEANVVVAGNPTKICQLNIFATELSELLSISKEKMIGFLTLIYDRKYYDYKTRNTEEMIMFNPYLVLLACETLDGITTKLKGDIVSGGFSRRAIFVLVTTPHRRIAFPEITPEAKACYQSCVETCKKLQEVGGEFTWTDEAKIWYKDWYEKLKIPSEPALAGYYDSKQTHLLKVAMLIAASEGEYKLVMRKEYLLLALKFLEQIEVNLPRVFEGMGRNILNNVTTKIVDIIKKSPIPLTEKDLRKITWSECDEREFTQIINHLIATEKVTAWKKGSPPNQKRLFCLKGSEPKEVLEALSKSSAEVDTAAGVVGVLPTPSPSVVPVQGSAPVTDPPSEQQLAQNVSLLQRLKSQPTAPSASSGSEAEPQKPAAA
jgi:hypothetical protein